MLEITYAYIKFPQSLRHPGHPPLQGFFYVHP